VYKEFVKQKYGGVYEHEDLSVVKDFREFLYKYFEQRIYELPPAFKTNFQFKKKYIEISDIQFVFGNIEIIELLKERGYYTTYYDPEKVHEIEKEITHLV
jgi:hypothetical protein